MEATQVSVYRWVDEWNEASTHNRLLFNFKKERNSDTSYNTKELWGYYAKWPSQSQNENTVWVHLNACMLSCFSRVRLFETPWTVAWQASLSMGFSRQGHWSGLPCFPPGDLPDPGIEHTSLTSPALAGRSFTSIAFWEALWDSTVYKILVIFKKNFN